MKQTAVVVPVVLLVLLFIFPMLLMIAIIEGLKESDASTGFPNEVDGIDPVVLQAYFLAETQTEEISPGCEGMTWPLIAAIGYIESKHATYSSDGNNDDREVNDDGVVEPPIIGVALDGSGGVEKISDTDDGELDDDDEWDRAVGPMQFIPESWEIYGQDGNGDGEKDPQNIFDAAAATVRHLCLSGGNDLTTDSGLERAIMGYNESRDYLEDVLERMEHYEGFTVGNLALDPDAECGGKPDREPGYAAADGSVTEHTLHPEMCELYAIMGTSFADQDIWLGPMTPGGDLGENQENHHCLRPNDTGNHGTGLACDFYVGYHDGNAKNDQPESHAKAQEVINMLMQESDSYTNMCIIYEQRIWFASAGTDGDWLELSRPMEDRGNDNENHYNHIHLSVGGDGQSC